MASAVRYTKTFLDIQYSVLKDGEWLVKDVPGVSIDDAMNDWVKATNSVITGIYVSVEPLRLSDEQYQVVVRYVATYMREQDYLELEAALRPASTQVQKVPEVSETRGPAKITKIPEKEPWEEDKTERSMIEALNLATEMQKAIQDGDPEKIQDLKKGQRVVRNPTPPIKLENPLEEPKDLPQVRRHSVHRRSSF